MFDVKKSKNKYVVKRSGLHDAANMTLKEFKHPHLVPYRHVEEINGNWYIVNRLFERFSFYRLPQILILSFILSLGNNNFNRF